MAFPAQDVFEQLLAIASIMWLAFQETNEQTHKANAEWTFDEFAN
jgi:hypothetical protein